MLPQSYIPLSIPCTTQPILLTNVAFLPPTSCILIPPNRQFVDTYSPIYTKSCSFLPIYYDDNNSSDHLSTQCTIQQSCYSTIQPLSYVFTQIPTRIVNYQQYQIPCYYHNMNCKCFILLFYIIRMLVVFLKRLYYYYYTNS